MAFSRLADAILEPPSDVIYSWGAHARGQLLWWRMVTANFVHFGLLHLVFNCMALRYIGQYVERTFGSSLTAASFTLLGTGSMLCSSFFGERAVVAGASGGIMALVGMGIVAAQLEHTHLSMQIRNGLVKWAAFTMAFGLLLTYTSGIGIDNIAHVSGLILGVLAGFVLPRMSTTGFVSRTHFRTASMAAIVSLCITAVAFTMMASSKVSVAHQKECIAKLQLKDYGGAERECEAAYRHDKTQEISFHNYILVELILGRHSEAARLCDEGRHADGVYGYAPKPSFDAMCRSIGH